MVIFEAVNAYYGDCILLHFKEGAKTRRWLVDGGPNQGEEVTWPKYLLPRLKQLKGNAQKLGLDLVMVSHADGDHIQGLLAMMKAILKTNDPLKWIDIKLFWHNSFEDVLTEAGASPADVDGASLASVGASPVQRAAELLSKSDYASLQGLKKTEIYELEDEHRQTAFVATIGEGRELRDYLNTLQLGGNDPFGGFIAAPAKKGVNGVSVHVIGPIRKRVDEFRAKWRAAVVKPRSPAREAELADLIGGNWDTSPTNLSSLVLLLKLHGRRILLTGDARSDDILKGFADSELENGAPYPIDVLKMPHHGSDRNLNHELIEKFPADHYVISGDGHHDNPDRATLEAIVKTRAPTDTFTIHLTNEVPGHRAALDQLKAGRAFNYRFRDKNKLSMSIELSPKPIE